MSAKTASGEFSPINSVEVRRLRGRDAVLTLGLRTRQRGLARLEQRVQRQLTGWHEARNTGAHRNEALGPGARMMHQQIAYALGNNLSVLRRLLGRFALSQNGERAAIPTTNEVSTTPVRCRDNASDAANARIPGRLVERLVVGAEVVDIKQGEADLV